MFTVEWKNVKCRSHVDICDTYIHSKAHTHTCMLTGMHMYTAGIHMYTEASTYVYVHGIMASITVVLTHLYKSTLLCLQA